MELLDITVEHLKQLPLRAIVAFAVRCARRVEQHAELPEGHPQRESRRAAIEAALRMAEAFAQGSDAPPDESVIAAVTASRNVTGGPPGSADATAAAAEAAHAAAGAWQVAFERREEVGPWATDTAEAGRCRKGVEDVTAELAALNALTAAEDANVSIGYHNEGFLDAARSDYNQLIRLKAGRYPELGNPIDPSTGGPLGRL
jgi:hypothetical protein